MRVWRYRLLPYLPDAQFKGQLRELYAIKRDWGTKGRTNHLLINRVMLYPKSHLYSYAVLYAEEYERRYNKSQEKLIQEFADFAGEDAALVLEPFPDWHDLGYLRVCMANVYEKYAYALGSSKVSGAAWSRMVIGYRNITGMNYHI